MFYQARAEEDNCVEFLSFFDAPPPISAKAPFICWIFSAGTLVAAANRIPSGDGGVRFGTLCTSSQTQLRWSMDVLSALNGLAGEEFLEMALRAGFAVEHQRYVTTERFQPRRRFLYGLNGALYCVHPFGGQLLNYNPTCFLRKVH